jgi:hypothetical protein
LLAEDYKRQTTWNLAVRLGKVEVQDKMWEWAKKVLNRDEIIRKLFVVRDEREKTVFHYVKFSDNVQLLEGVWKWANEQLTPEELKEFELAQHKGRQTAWHVG